MEKTKYELSVPGLLERAYQTMPESEAVVDGYRRLSYKDLFTEATQLAIGLAKIGIEKGDRVAVCLPNWHEFVTLCFALPMIGAIVVPFNPRYKIEEAKYILENSEAKVAFFCHEFDNASLLSHFLQEDNRLYSLKHVITVRYKEQGHYSYNTLLDLGRNCDLPATSIDTNDGFVIVYTSGTTGNPKGALLSHKNVVFTSVKTTELLKYTIQDIILVALPVFHVFGLIPCVLSTIVSGARMVLMERYKAESALELIEVEGITIHHGVPTMFNLELNHPNLNSYNLSSLRTGIIAGAPCPIETVSRIKTEMNCDILISYGMTETSTVTTITDLNDDDLLKVETVGKAIPDVEIRIVNENRQEVPIGKVGEIAVRGLGVMKGYLNMPEYTNQVIDEEGWFYTGDLASIDSNGYIRISGRKKDLIIRGGYNIYPVEIEEILYSHPSIMAVSVVGLPDSVLGEITCAAIQLIPEKVNTVTTEEIRLYIKERVVNYKVPDQIVFLDQLPQTPSGKISKGLLQKHLIDLSN